MIPERLIADIPVPLLAGPDEADGISWEWLLVETIVQANERLREARQYQSDNNPDLK
ncbi:hypothetical protein ACTXGQ_04275 [Marinobacter sp. 1Y8]